MKDFRFGLKLWSLNHNLLNEAKKLIEEDFFHYIELLVVPNTEISFFQRVKVPYIIHITHENYGLNIADNRKWEANLRTVYFCLRWADKLRAKYLVLHPGFGEINKAIRFLEKIDDKRILIENVPKVGLNQERMIGFNPKQIRELIGRKFGFCLDFNHAVKSAVSLKKDYKKHIEDFLKLSPKMFHISDGILEDEKDNHLNIGEGEYDFNFLADCIKKSQAKYITLETPRANLSSFEEDLENVKKLKSILFRYE